MWAHKSKLFCRISHVSLSRWGINNLPTDPEDWGTPTVVFSQLFIQYIRSCPSRLKTFSIRELGVGFEIILKWILKKYCLRLWIEFIWLRGVRYYALVNGVLSWPADRLPDCLEILCSIELENFLCFLSYWLTDCQYISLNLYSCISLRASFRILWNALMLSIEIPLRHLFHWCNTYSCLFIGVVVNRTLRYEIIC
jgi:hypothetical protein